MAFVFSGQETDNIHKLFFLFLGRECLRRLVKHGIRCSYVLISALSYVIKEVCNNMQAWECMHRTRGEVQSAMVLKCNNVWKLQLKDKENDLVSLSATTNKSYDMSSRLGQIKNSFSWFGVQLSWNALPENIKNSASRDLFKKQIHKTLVNILKQENLYLTSSSILEIIKNL